MTTQFHHLLILLTSLAIHFVTGLSDDSATSKDGTGSGSRGKNSSNVVIIIILLVVLVVLLFLLFKFWQKKKREEQYAQLLKLFEEDDDLELELGLRD